MLKQPKGGCDVERSFVHYSNLRKSDDAKSMNATTMETRVMAQWNQEILAQSTFGVRNCDMMLL